MKCFLSDSFDIEDIQEFGYFATKKKLKETFWWKEKKHYGALRNEPKVSPLSLTRHLGQVNTSKPQSWKTKEHVWKQFIKTSKSKHGGKNSGPQCRLWTEAIDIGTHVSEESPCLGTHFCNVMKTTTNSAISKSFVDIAKTVTSALKGATKYLLNKWLRQNVPHQWGLPDCD